LNDARESPASAAAISRLATSACFGSVLSTFADCFAAGGWSESSPPLPFPAELEITLRNEAN
jgi:hypothetical protein